VICGISHNIWNISDVGASTCVICSKEDSFRMGTKTPDMEASIFDLHQVW